jgi:uncharacterized Zn finger protein
MERVRGWYFERSMEMAGNRKHSPFRVSVAQEVNMECTRCHGLMAKERLYDLLENDGQIYVSGWRWAYRCVVCGKVSDWVIEQNRQIAVKAVTGNQRRRNLSNAEAGTA